MLLSSIIFVPTNTQPLLIMDKWFIQIYLNVNWKYLILKCWANKNQIAMVNQDTTLYITLTIIAMLATKKNKR